MRKLLLVFLFGGLSGCHQVGSDPWTLVDYTQAGCGTKEAVMNNAGCAVNSISEKPRNLTDNATKSKSDY